MRFKGGFGLNLPDDIDTAPPTAQAGDFGGGVVSFEGGGSPLGGLSGGMGGQGVGDPADDFGGVVISFDTFGGEEPPAVLDADLAF